MDIYINIDVDDLERGIDFYSALGLRLVRRLFDGAVAEMSGANAPVHLLHTAPGSRGGAGTSPAGSGLGPHCDRVRSVRPWRVPHAAGARWLRRRGRFWIAQKNGPHAGMRAMDAGR